MSSKFLLAFVFISCTAEHLAEQTLDRFASGMAGLNSKEAAFNRLAVDLHLGGTACMSKDQSVQTY